MYTTNYSQLFVCTLDEDANSKCCNYWYTVTTVASSYVAFNKRQSFLNWLEHRGLTLGGELPPHGTRGGVGIIGRFKECSHQSREEFAAISPVYSIRVMENGGWTEGKVTVDADGIHTVHHMNCNYERVVFDYRESDEMYG